MEETGDDTPRCGRTTKSGRPCRNQVERPGRPCRIHMKAALLERLLGTSESDDATGGGSETSEVDADDAASD